MQSVDIVIIGGGPAGLSTAMHLLRLDPSWAERMVVLEKASHPRPKLCAGGITRFGLAQLRELGLRLGVPYVRVERARMEYCGRTLEVLGRPIFAVTRREEFDAWLAAEARARGVPLMEDCPVHRLERHPEGLIVHTEDRSFLARAVVGADGSRGLVRRWLNGPERPPRVARLLEVVTPASGSEHEYRTATARFDFSHVSRHLQGYYWDFPSQIAGRPFMNHGLYDARMAPGRPMAALPALLREALAAHGIPEEQGTPLEGHPIHWFSPWNRLSAPRVLLVGDAAGVDPLFGEGIAIALAYGQLAAESLQRATRRGDFRLADYKRRVLTSSLGRYLLLRWFGARVAYPLSRSHLFMRALWRSGGLLARIIGPGHEVPDLPPPPPVLPRSPAP